MVAAQEHSERVAPELARQDGETADERAARAEAMIASRVPDIRFLLEYLLASEKNADPARIGIVGHSFGGWTALAAPDVEPRIRSVVALAPGGASNPRPGVLPLALAFHWGRDIPTLFLVAENDISLPLSGMHEIFERTPATKRMVILRRADHLHFVDNVEQQHEAARNMTWPPELAWLQKEMLPIAELCSGEQAHLFVRGLTLGHLDATLKQQDEAQRFWAGHIQKELGARGVDAIVYQ
jgi:dienelactone hydrolase